MDSMLGLDSSSQSRDWMICNSSERRMKRFKRRNNIKGKQHTAFVEVQLLIQPVDNCQISQGAAYDVPSSAELWTAH